MIKYEGRRTHLNPYRIEDEEFDTKEEAEKFVETGPHKIGEVITWHVGPNLPYALPKLKYSSCALQVLQEDGTWKPVNIF
jgi:hypothetical protein